MRILKPIAFAASRPRVACSSFTASRAPYPAGLAGVLGAALLLPLGAVGQGVVATDRPALLLAQAPSQRLPATPAPPPTFQLSAVTFTGATMIPSAELDALAQPYLGRDIALPDLETLAKAVTDLYRSRGYFLAQAVVPVQTVRDGKVEISVIEGRIGTVQINVADDAPISETRVRAYLHGLRPGEAVNAAQYERSMLLLSDQPGIKVASGLQEGVTPGTSDLVVDVTAAPKLAFAADVDNHGTRESGRMRVGGTLRVASPFGIGDNLDARAMWSDGNSLNFGRLAYEAPLNANGLRLGVGVAHVRYELGGPLSALGAKGTADVVDASLNYPLIRQRNENLFLRFGVDQKALKDDLDVFSYTSKKRVRGVSAGWSWEKRDDWLGGGYWASTGTLYQGDLKIKDDLSRSLDQSAVGHGTEGSFTKFTWQFSRLQSVLPRHTLYVSLGGQLTNKNLDASEKLALGGARAVRSFPSGEALVDQGVLSVVEWRWAATEDLTPYVFYDAGRGKLFHKPTAFDGPNTRSMQGVGVGTVWSKPGNFSLNVSLSWRINSDAPTTDGGDRKPRIFAQFQKVF